MTTFHVDLANIQWDTDGENPNRESWLPQRESFHAIEADDLQEAIEKAMEYATDKRCYCIQSCEPSGYPLYERPGLATKAQPALPHVE